MSEKLEATQMQEDFIIRLKNCKNSKGVSQIYADLIDATTLENANKHSLNISAINAFILSKYSISTFKSIKQAAWKIADKKLIEARA